MMQVQVQVKKTKPRRINQEVYTVMQVQVQVKETKRRRTNREEYTVASQWMMITKSVRSVDADQSQG